MHICPIPPTDRLALRNTVFELYSRRSRKVIRLVLQVIKRLIKEHDKPMIEIF